MILVPLRKGEAWDLIIVDVAGRTLEFHSTEAMNDRYEVAEETESETIESRTNQYPVLQGGCSWYLIENALSSYGGPEGPPNNEMSMIPCPHGKSDPTECFVYFIT